MTDDHDHDVTLVRWHAATFFLLIALALGYWIWFGLTQRGIIEDEGISILMAEGILEHGYRDLRS